MTYITVLSTSDAEALALAESCTGRDSHVRRLGRGTRKCASIGAFSDTARVTPAGRQSSLRRRESRDGLGACSSRGSLSGGTNSVASRKRVERLAVNANNFIYNRGTEFQLASAGLVVVDVWGKQRTQSSIAIHVRASVDALLQLGDVPAVHEISVPRVANRVTSTGNIRSFTPVRMVGNIDESFEEDADEVNRILWGTAAVVKAANRVRYVGLVVRAIEVLTIPARRHEDLETNAVLALVDIGEAKVIALSVGRVVADSTRVVYRGPSIYN